MSSEAYADFYRRHKMLGRNEIPAEFAKEVIVGDLAERLEDGYENQLLHVWASAEWPERYIESSLWMMLFDKGNRDRLIPADTPDTMTLYRGAIKSRKSGMSWTSSLARATWFAERFNSLETGYVWKKKFLVML